MKSSLLNLNNYRSSRKFTATVRGVKLFVIALMLLFSFATGNALLAATTSGQPSSVAVAEDIEPPTVIINSPKVGASFDAGMMTTVLYRTSDNVGVVLQNILLSTDGVKFFAIAKEVPGNVTSIDFTFPMILTTKAILRIEAIDAAGNVGIALVNNISLLADVEPPMVTVIQPQANMKFKGNSMFDITFNTSDNVAIISHEIRIALDGKNFMPFVSGIEGDVQFYQIKVPNIKATAAVIRVIAIDSSGNIGMNDSGPFRIKKTKK